MVGEKLRLTIDSLANSGDGVGRIDGRVVFVPLSCPGDLLDVEITQDKKTFLKAKILSIIKPSPQRVDPPCQFYQSCGGCNLQHIQYQDQLLWKEKSLIETLQRIGKLDLSNIFSKTHPSPKQFHYRNRVQMFFSQQFYYNTRGSNQRVAVDQCLIAEPGINKFLENPQINKQNTKVELAIADDGVKVFPVNRHGVSELGFRQVNDGVNHLIVSELDLIIRDKKINVLFDLYCGHGNWSRQLCENNPALHGVGIDINEKSIRRATEKAPANVQYLLGKAELLFAKTDLPEPELMIIDPPRAGCTTTLLNLIIEARPPWLAYISCHPATLARDLRTLCDNGFCIEDIQAFDMFPQTSHLEGMVLLRGASS